MDPTSNLTFNLTLSDKEKEARSQVKLPYTYDKDRYLESVLYRSFGALRSVISEGFLRNQKIIIGLDSFIIAPAYSRVRYRSPNFCPSVRPLRQSLVFSTSEIAASLKPCIVIVPNIPFKHAP